MNLVKVGAAALNQTPLDWEGNFNNIVAAIREAKRAGVKLLCLPELCITGYGCEDMFLSEHVAYRAKEILFAIAMYTDNIAVALGLPIISDEGAVFNSAIFVSDSVVHISEPTCKQNLANDGIHYEDRWFKPWTGKTKIYDFCGIKVGFEICADAWVGNRIGIELAERGVDIILNPSASHFAFNKQNVRRRIVSEASRSLNVSYVYANLLGNEAGRIIYDGGCLIATEGGIVSESERFSYQPFVLTTKTIDVDNNRTLRRQNRSSVSSPGSSDVYPTGFKITTNKAIDEPEPKHNEWESLENLEFQEFTAAVSLGLYDYARKTNSSGFVVSLSGGVDSVAVATLVSEMITSATLSLVIGSVPTTNLLGHKVDKSIASKILTTIYQPTKNSSCITNETAKKVAEEIGSKHHIIDVNEINEAYIKLFNGDNGQELNWTDDDITLQNIQARVRGPMAWMFANKENKILLATSNRSEASVGYATMDGDTCGGLMPIGGVSKHFLIKWMRWLSQKGMKSLNSVLELAPSAELRPLDQKQSDENDLMPYHILDYIEKQAIGNKKSPKNTLLYLKEIFPDTKEKDLILYIEKFFQLWSRNQWKRERFAPSFHLDDRNLDPKTWCRFPILSGGFKEELRGLKK